MDKRFEHMARLPVEQWSHLNDHVKVLSVPGMDIKLQRFDSGLFHRKIGGFGVVYFCEVEPHDDSTVVQAIVKHVHHTDPTKQHLEDLNNDLYREIELIKRVSSLNLSPPLIGDFPFSAHEDGHSFHMFVQRKAEGDSLFDLKDTLDTTERIEVLWHVFQEFQRLHANGLFHSDVDLHHVYWCKTKKQVHLIDWGGGFYVDLEKGEAASKILSHKGKQFYASPEQRDSKPYDEQSEVFQLGMLAYFFLDDEKDGDSSPQFRDNHTSDGVELPSRIEVPEFFRELLYRATRYDAEDRILNVQQMISFWEQSCNPKRSSELIITTASGSLYEIGEENPHRIISGLSFVGNFGSMTSWSVSGDLEFLITHGPSIGEWQKTGTLNLYSRPMIIRSIESGEIYHLSIEDEESVTTFDAIHSSKNEVDVVVYQSNHSGEMFSVEERTVDEVVIQNLLTLEEQRITTSVLEMEFTKL